MASGGDAMGGDTGGRLVSVAEAVGVGVWVGSPEPLIPMPPMLPPMARTSGKFMATPLLCCGGRGGGLRA